MKTQRIELSKLRTDGGTQAREEISNDTVREYAAACEAGDSFPPIDVFYDGATYWIADGFHRFYGHRDAKKKDIECVVHQGTQRDAILFSVGANRTNGLRRTNADKRRAVMILLEDEEWSQWSDRVIADKAKVGHQLAADVRKELEARQAEGTGRSSSSTQPGGGETKPPKKRIGKDGKARTVKPSAKKPTPKADECLRGGSHEPDEDGDCWKCGEPGVGEKPRSARESFNVEEIEAEQAKQKAKAPKKDGWGIPIQEHAAPAFEAVPLFDELLSMLRKVKVLYADLAEKPGGAFLQRPGVSRNVNGRFRHDGLENLIAALEDSKPTYTVCPYEYHGAAIPESKHKHDKKCQLCHGLNWSRELGKQERSEKVIEFIKEKFGV